MKVEIVTTTLQKALDASGCEKAEAIHKPRLLLTMTVLVSRQI